MVDDGVSQEDDLPSDTSHDGQAPHDYFTGAHRDDGSARAADTLSDGVADSDLATASDGAQTPLYEEPPTHTTGHAPTVGRRGSRWSGLRRRIIGGVGAVALLCVALATGSALLLSSLRAAPSIAREATPTTAYTATSVPTVAYQAPKVVQSTPSGPTPTPPPVVSSPTPPPGPAPIGGVPGIGGQLILVSLGQQWLWAYHNGALLYDTPVTSGMPQLATPDGVYHIQYKQYDVTFYSPWPPGSPYYYSPEHINYAMYFADYGYYVHDAPWRHAFGPGTNYPHTDPDGTKETGSHGCVNVPTPAGAWLYNWAYNGATVDIFGTATTGPAATPTPSSTATATATSTATAPTPTQPTSPTPTVTPTITPTTDPTATPTP